MNSLKAAPKPARSESSETTRAFPAADSDVNLPLKSCSFCSRFRYRDDLAKAYRPSDKTVRCLISHTSGIEQDLVNDMRAVIVTEREPPASIKIFHELYGPGKFQRKCLEAAMNFVINSERLISFPPIARVVRAVGALCSTLEEMLGGDDYLFRLVGKLQGLRRDCGVPVTIEFIDTEQKGEFALQREKNAEIAGSYVALFKRKVASLRENFLPIRERCYEAYRSHQYHRALELHARDQKMREQLHAKDTDEPDQLKFVVTGAAHKGVARGGRRMPIVRLCTDELRDLIPSKFHRVTTSLGLSDDQYLINCGPLELRHYVENAIGYLLETTISKAFDFSTFKYVDRTDAKRFVTLGIMGAMSFETKQQLLDLCFRNLEEAAPGHCSAMEALLEPLHIWFKGELDNEESEVVPPWARNILSRTLPRSLEDQRRSASGRS